MGRLSCWPAWLNKTTNSFSWVIESMELKKDPEVMEVITERSRSGPAKGFPRTLETHVSDGNETQIVEWHMCN